MFCQWEVFVSGKSMWCHFCWNKIVCNVSVVGRKFHGFTFLLRISLYYNLKCQGDKFFPQKPICFTFCWNFSKEGPYIDVSKIVFFLYLKFIPCSPLFWHYIILNIVWKLKEEIVARLTMVNVIIKMLKVLGRLWSIGFFKLLMIPVGGRKDQLEMDRPGGEIMRLTSV